MVRTPCCDNNGLKKGTWTPEEDKKLADYINRYGHWNWRLLPKFAGLARCGKSCRLRWLNYLRPNLKRGNYTSVEEETIIKLHQLLGNRWSAIAAQMPGRTDNEIKNYWHTNLKKRYDYNSVTKAKVSNSKDHPPVESANNVAAAGNSFQNLDATQLAESCSFSQHFNSSSSETSSASTECPAVSSNENLVLEDEFAFLDADMSPLAENFWLEPYNTIDIISAVPSSEPEYFSLVFDAELWNHDNYSSLW